jgi:hypothetical protein
MTRLGTLSTFIGQCGRDKYDMSPSKRRRFFHKLYLRLASYIIRKEKVEAEEKEFSENQFPAFPSIISPRY